MFSEVLGYGVPIERNRVSGVSCGMDKSYVLCRILVFALILSRRKPRKLQNWKGN